MRWIRGYAVAIGRNQQCTLLSMHIVVYGWSAILLHWRASVWVAARNAQRLSDRPAIP